MNHLNKISVLKEDNLALLSDVIELRAEIRALPDTTGKSEMLGDMERLRQIVLFQEEEFRKLENGRSQRITLRQFLSQWFR